MGLVPPLTLSPFHPAVCRLRPAVPTAPAGAQHLHGAPGHQAGPAAHGHRGEWWGAHGGDTQKWELSRPGGHRVRPAPFFLPSPRSTWRIWLSLAVGQPLGLPPFGEKLGADPEG